ncbi:hypothetical protein [Nocardia sp. CDC160]|uniref:hypothetical protein n=1 Tax=Nocardia sp. CDC160 TaxID=3112166 RepID=UPI002DB9F867|nr:hypothetical protein [Nocardia sp. CDC160]MEC3914756.1 hypothetical protein [Nocardia sp. CDC160]
MSATLNLTDQDKATIRSAAYGAVSLISAASGKAHKAATAGSLALGSATGQIGHLLNTKSKDIHLSGKTVAELADQVLPALTSAAAVLERQNPVEADNFRTTVLVAVEAAAATGRNGYSSPVVTDMTRKITTALHAA